jgi:two-component system sensor histidine kinase DesK
MSATARTLHQVSAPSQVLNRALIVAVAVAVVALAPIFTIFGTPGGTSSGSPTAAIPLALAALVLQLRHGFAIADGRVPRGAQWSTLALAGLAWVPLPWFGWNWLALQMCVLASLPLLLRGRALGAAVAVPLVATGASAAIANGQYAGIIGIGGISFIVFYELFAQLSGALALYGSARLVRMVDELHETRAELAASAVGQERLRISRDLHDLLGQSLSAISLKGDLAKRLLRRDPAAARAEVEGVAELARATLRGMRAISRDQHAVSLATESEGALALLAAAGIEAQLQIDLPDLAPEVEHTLAWALREGVTNVLRHSQARSCTVTGARGDRSVVLEIINDGAADTRDEGQGLRGLTERVRALSGSIRVVHTEGRFRLRVEMPEVPA